MARHCRTPVRAGVAAHGLEHRLRPADSVLFAGLDAATRFYFVHSYATQTWDLPPSDHFATPGLTWAEHGVPFLAAVENGALSATQFHPEKSGDAGAHLLRNWVNSL